MPDKADDVASELAVTLRGEMLGTHVAIAKRDGHRVRCEVIGGGTDPKMPAVIIEVAIATRRRLELWVVRGNPDREAVAFGDEIDVEIGLPSFDDLFHVEGAPSDVVRVLFDPDLCKLLASLPGPELSTAIVDERAILRLRLATWNQSNVIRGLDGVIRLIGRIEESYEIADAVETHGDSPYRADITPLARLDAARDRDFAALYRARRSRTWWRQLRRLWRRRPLR